MMGSIERGILGYSAAKTMPIAHASGSKSRSACVAEPCRCFQGITE